MVYSEFWIQGNAVFLNLGPQNWTQVPSAVEITLNMVRYTAASDLSGGNVSGERQRFCRSKTLPCGQFVEESVHEVRASVLETNFGDVSFSSRTGKRKV